MNHFDRLKTLTNIVYKEQPAYSFDEFFDFLSKLPDMQEDMLQTKSDANILNLIIDYIQVFEKLCQQKNSQPNLSTRTQSNGTITFIIPESEKKSAPDLKCSKTNYAKKSQHTENHIPKDKQFPEFFKAWYFLYIVGSIILTGLNFYNNHFVVAILYLSLSSLYIYAYCKLEQRAFNTAFIILTIVSFIINSISLTSALLVNPNSVNVSLYAYPVAIKIYFCVMLSRITSNKAQLKHPFLLFIGACVSTIFLLSLTAIGFEQLIAQITPLAIKPSFTSHISDLPEASSYLSTSSTEKYYPTEDTANANDTSKSTSDLEVNMYGIPIVYWNASDKTFHLDPDCPYRVDGKAFTSSADIAFKKDVYTSCPHCVSSQDERKVHASICKKENLTEEQRRSIEIQHMRESVANSE